MKVTTPLRSNIFIGGDAGLIDSRDSPEVQRLLV